VVALVLEALLAMLLGVDVVGDLDVVSVPFACGADDRAVAGLKLLEFAASGLAEFLRLELFDFSTNLSSKNLDGDSDKELGSLHKTAVANRVGLGTNSDFNVFDIETKLLGNLCDKGSLFVFGERFGCLVDGHLNVNGFGAWDIGVAGSGIRVSILDSTFSTTESSRGYDSEGTGLGSRSTGLGALTVVTILPDAGNRRVLDVAGVVLDLVAHDIGIVSGKAEITAHVGFVGGATARQVAFVSVVLFVNNISDESAVEVSFHVGAIFARDTALDCGEFQAHVVGGPDHGFGELGAALPATLALAVLATVSASQVATSNGVPVVISAVVASVNTELAVGHVDLEKVSPGIIVDAIFVIFTITVTLHTHEQTGSTVGSSTVLTRGTVQVIRDKRYIGFDEAVLDTGLRSQGCNVQCI